MSEYEITYIVSAKAGDEGRDTLNTDFEKQLSTLEGKMEHSTAALRQQLAYPIKDERTAFVRTVQITLDPGKLAELHRFLTKNEYVLRFTVLNTPRREELPTDLLKELGEDAPKRAPRKPAKKVTMEDVEKGIEDALTEEIK